MHCRCVTELFCYNLELVGDALEGVDDIGIEM
jgi:hypothetical protein